MSIDTMTDIKEVRERLEGPVVRAALNGSQYASCEVGDLRALLAAPEGWVMVRAERLATWIDATGGFSEVDVLDTFAAHLDMLAAAQEGK